MRIRDSAAFVTGANRGLDLAFAQELLAAGARAAFWDYLTEPFVFAAT
jgi:NAD(P)-dependent dehydrogenase (short-subunit alcohol dehydrogenase family)